MSSKSTLPSTSESKSKTDAAGDEKEQILSGFDTVDQFTQQTLRTALQATKSSNELPACGDDFDYYSSFDSFRNVMDVERRRIIHLMKQILTHQGVKGNLSQDYLDTEDTFDTLADANDQILETVGSLLDEASGVKKKEQTLVVASFKGRTTHQASWNKKSPGSSEKGFRLLSAHNIKRPQMKFKDKVDNSNKPFVPIIRSKPNAIKSLSDSLKIPNDQDANDPKFVYPHPYQFELEEFSPLPEQLEKVEAVEIPGPVSLSPALMIATTSDLVQMLDYLKTVKEIAVDLEHHSYRTFQGFTCLIQLSTRDRDYLVDALELRSDLHLLNEVFTDPSIIKVFHGADSDIEWLQRDFGVYVVNMFDTGQAARVLHYARFSLAHLLEVCCQVTADKQYQLADWRIRPLPCELIKYAQEDTHYLLYIHDVLRNELIEKGNEQKNLLMSVFQRSKQICSKVYNRPILTEDSYLNLYHQSKKVFNSQQIHCLKKLYEWRDKTARLEDESPGYVLPKHMLLQIADILPRERQGVLACCNPTPPLVRQNVIDLHSIVMEAREVPLVKVTKRRSMLPSAHQHPKFQPSLLFHSPHDHSHPEVESAQEKTTLLDPSLVAVTSRMFTSPVVRGVPVKESPLLSAFGWKPEVLRTEAQRKAREVKETFRNPFELYLPKPDKVGTKAPEKSEVPKWKFMEHTTPEPAPKPQVKGIRPEDKPLVTKEEEETMVPLSHQFSNPKKRKKSEEVLVETTEVDQPKKKKEKVLTTETFQPYDYSQANMGMFDAATKKDKKKYDPDGALRSKKEHKVYKSKLPAGTGKKSYTYGKGDKSSSKQNWPKR